jgi:hypothetical protein
LSYVCNYFLIYRNMAHIDQLPEGVSVNAE